MNLVANTGIQFISFPIEINLTDSFRMYFHECIDEAMQQQTLEIAHHFSESDVWVRKKDVFDLLGLGAVDGKVGWINNDGVFQQYKWSDIKGDLNAHGIKPINTNPSQKEDHSFFSLTTSRCRWEKFENIWIPLPFFSISNIGKPEFLPLNWCRCKFIPENSIENIKKYTVLMAFDTRSIYEGDSYEPSEINETPVFASEFEQSKEFALCRNEFMLLDYCSQDKGCDWVDNYIYNVIHGPTSKRDQRPNSPRLNYLAQYVFLLNYIQQLNVFPQVTLFSEINNQPIEVDLVLDIGNSRTCAVLVEDHDFTKVQALGLQDHTNPVLNGDCRRYSNPFDMRMVFREVEFGVDTLRGSKQFVYPSIVRLGVEANELLHQATSLNNGLEKHTTFSSPKRYLWDEAPQEKEWEFLVLKDERNKNRLVQIPGVTEYINFDGTFCSSGDASIHKKYSRKALMTFGFIEILTQAFNEINSYHYRSRWGSENRQRILSRIIVTSPTAMSRPEQFSMRKCAEDAASVMNRFFFGDVYSKKLPKSNLITNVIPASSNLMAGAEKQDWIYDEATCPQFVYLFSELSKKYKNNFSEYFDFYGKVRKGSSHESKKSLTIGSVDIGAGTTDVMVASYDYNGKGSSTLKPVPLFWESFYLAGDDLIKKLIRILIIDGPLAAIPNHLKICGRENEASKLISDFFGQDNARQSISFRRLRCEFNLQVSVPVASKFLQILVDNTDLRSVLGFDNVFSEIKPAQRVLDHFQSHFGFSIRDIIWNYDREIVTKTVQSTFDPLVSKISALINYFECDFMLLSGRPSSLKPLTDLFFMYHAVSPNRLITMNNYKVGKWYPFQNDKGYFNDSKSIVAMGALIANYSSAGSGYNGLNLDLTELISQTKPTTDYFAEGDSSDSIITPEQNRCELVVSHFPKRIWARQFSTKKYPTRPFYNLDFNIQKVKLKVAQKYELNPNDERSLQNYTSVEINRINLLKPFKFIIVRESYAEDKELLIIDSVEDCNKECLPIEYFHLQIQSLNESDIYWLDTGEFTGLVNY
jgi:hypothetical protein